MNAIVMLLGGGGMLYLGAEWLVGGASALALSMRVPQLLVGLTVVAFGTSAPEIVVSLQAAYSGREAVALGNVIGSNIANLGLILGATVLVRPARVDGALRRRELPVLLASTAFVPALLAFDGHIRNIEAGLLLMAALGYTGWMIRTARSGTANLEATQAAEATADAADVAGAPAPGRSRARHAVIAAAGLGVLLAGGHFFVEGAVSLARTWGMSERVVGLTIVAVGTSVPELATSLIAAAKGHSDIAVGNVIGSNIFNVLVCLGAAGVAGRVAAPLSALWFDVAALSTITLIACVFMRTERTVRRWEGAVLLGSYAMFIAVLALTGG